MKPSKADTSWICLDMETFASQASGILPVDMAMNTQVVEHKETVFLDL